MKWPSRRRSPGYTVTSAGPRAMAVGLCLALAALAWLAYDATLESRRGARLLLERRAAEQLALLSAGLSGDMKGAHATVLVPVTPGQLVLDPPYDLADAFARGFARFPYPESFFAWKASPRGDESTYVFNRSDRRPPWLTSEPLAGPYPVHVLRDPAPVLEVVREAIRQARHNRPFAVFETRIAGAPYQVVVNLLYRGEEPARLFGLVGFTVNLDWVRQHYFRELTSQIASIGGDAGEISLAVLDDGGGTVAASYPGAGDIAAVERPFPLVFLDRALLRTLPPQGMLLRTWTARAGAAQGSRLAAAAAGNDRTFALITLAALAAMVGLIVTARGVRVAAELAAMKSDFVSSVTHELKTPLALIRLIADTLVRGRYGSPDTLREYSALLAQQSKDLTRLIDNLLAYARLSDVRHAYLFEATDVSELVEDALQHCRALLAEQQFEVTVELPPDLPPVRADRSAVVQALENLIDNAVKYSDGTRVLRIHAEAAGNAVSIVVADRGVGIRQDEIPHVCDKFFRGRNVRASGSGLGLAIARQVVQDHGGRLGINSVVGQGTRVDVFLPVARAS